MNETLLNFYFILLKIAVICVCVAKIYSAFVRNNTDQNALFSSINFAIVIVKQGKVHVLL